MYVIYVASNTKPTKSFCPCVNGRRRSMYIPAGAFRLKSIKFTSELLIDKLRERSVGNEVTFFHKDCIDPWYDNVTPF